MFTPEMKLKDRLRTARENAGLSRAQLFAKTNIPTKSIEKIETGHMEPTIDRVKIIAEECNIPFKDLIIGPDPEEIGLSEKVEDLGQQLQSTVVMNIPDNSKNQITIVTENLNLLDGMRQAGFKGHIRAATALTKNFHAGLEFLEIEVLMKIAEERGLNLSENLSTQELADLLYAKPLIASMTLHEIQNRIVDTAVFGVDLYNVDLDILHDIANDFEDREEDGFIFENTGMLGFAKGQHETFIPANRESLRQLALIGEIDLLKKIAEKAPEPEDNY